jgi:hypothetical protein
MYIYIYVYVNLFIIYIYIYSLIGKEEGAVTSIEIVKGYGKEGVSVISGSYWLLRYEDGKLEVCIIYIYIS